MKLSVIKEIEKYSFVTKVIIEKNSVFIYYSVDGKDKYKKIAMRQSVANLQKLLSDIRKEAGVNVYGTPKHGKCYIA